MKEIREPMALGRHPKMKISGSPKTAERLRRQRVPAYYARCAYRKVTSRPYDHLTEETPMFVECRHTEFGRQNYSECLGQCASAKKQYGE